MERWGRDPWNEEKSHLVGWGQDPWNGEKPHPGGIHGMERSPILWVILSLPSMLSWFPFQGGSMEWREVPSCG